MLAHVECLECCIDVGFNEFEGDGDRVWEFDRLSELHSSTAARRVRT